MNQSMKFFEKHKQIVFKKPTTLLRLLSINRKKYRYVKVCSRFVQCRFFQGLFNCNNETCILCALCIKPFASFKTSNIVIWYIRSHITCQSKNVIYLLRCTSCNYTTTSIGKAVYFHELITISLVIDFKTPRTNLTTTYFIACRIRNRNRFFKY